MNLKALWDDNYHHKKDNLTGYPYITRCPKPFLENEKGEIEGMNSRGTRELNTKASKYTKPRFTEPCKRNEVIIRKMTPEEKAKYL